MRAHSDFANHFIELLRISTLLAQDMAEELELTRTQLGALYRIGELGRCTMSDLKRDFDVTTGAITGLVDRLEALALVRRVPSQDDRRVVYLELTPAGVAKVEASMAAWDRRLTEWLGRLPEPAREQAKAAIAALVAAGPPKPL